MADYRFSRLSVRVSWHDSGWNGHLRVSTDGLLPLGTREISQVTMFGHRLAGLAYRNSGRPVHEKRSSDDLGLKCSPFG